MWGFKALPDKVVYKSSPRHRLSDSVGNVCLERTVGWEEVNVHIFADEVDQEKMFSMS